MHMQYPLITFMCLCCISVFTLILIFAANHYVASLAHPLSTRLSDTIPWLSAISLSVDHPTVSKVSWSDVIVVLHTPCPIL